jgi:hypothetical protein
MLTCAPVVKTSCQPALRGPRFSRQSLQFPRY